MSTLRYSGQIRIRLTYLEPRTDDVYSNGTPRNANGSYRCFLRGPDGARTTIVVGAILEHGSGIGVDSPEAFDDAARAAIAFADDEADEARRTGEDYDSWGDYGAHDGSDWHVGRSLNTAWGAKGGD